MTGFKAKLEEEGGSCVGGVGKTLAIELGTCCDLDTDLFLKIFHSNYQQEDPTENRRVIARIPERIDAKIAEYEAKILFPKKAVADLTGFIEQLGLLESIDQISGDLAKGLQKWGFFSLPESPLRSAEVQKIMSFLVPKEILNTGIAFNQEGETITEKLEDHFCGLFKGKILTLSRAYSEVNQVVPLSIIKNEISELIRNTEAKIDYSSGMLRRGPQMPEAMRIRMLARCLSLILDEFKLEKMKALIEELRTDLSFFRNFEITMQALIKSRFIKIYYPDDYINELTEKLFTTENPNNLYSSFEIGTRVTDIIVYFLRSEIELGKDTLNFVIEKIRRLDWRIIYQEKFIIEQAARNSVNDGFLKFFELGKIRNNIKESIALIKKRLDKLDESK